MAHSLQTYSILLLEHIQATAGNFMIWEIMAWFADILVNYRSGRLSKK